MMEGEAQNLIKIITLGESTVGKSAYIDKYVYGTFRHKLPTIGFNTNSKNYSLPNGESVKIIFEDTSGQERFRSLSFNFIRKADGVALMYDITKKNTFDTVSNGVMIFGTFKKKIFPLFYLEINAI